MFDFFTNTLKTVGSFAGGIIISLGLFLGGSQALPETGQVTGETQEIPTTENSHAQVGSVIEQETNEEARINEEKNYRAEVVIAINNRIKFDSETESFINELLSYVDLVIKRFTDTKSSTIRYGGDDKLTELAVAYYGDVVTWAQAVRAQIAYSNTKLQADREWFQTNLNSLPDHVSKERALEEIGVAENLTAVQDLRDATAKIYNDFRVDITNQDAQLEMAFKVASEKASYQVTQPVQAAPLLPQVKAQKATYTSCSVDGDRIYCTSY